MRSTALRLGCVTVFLLIGGMAKAGYTTIVDNGPSSNRVDMVFLGDGYTQADLDAGTYGRNISTAMNYFFAQQPLSRYQNFFNVHQVDLVSAQSGATIAPQGIYLNTALGSKYYYDGVTERLLYVDDSLASSALRTNLAGSGFSSECTFIAINDDIYGGGGGQYAAFAAGNSRAAATAVHEFGHMFADLADEYAYTDRAYTWGEPAAANITTNTDPATVKWANWIGYVDPDHPDLGPVGIFEGADDYTSGLYRPTLTSTMRESNKAFNAIDREQIILSIYKLVRPLDSYLPTAGTLDNPAGLWVNAVDPDVIDVKWFLDGALLPQTGEQLDLASLGLAAGTYHFSALAYDNSIGDWIRTNEQSAEEQVAWNVYLVPDPTALSLLAMAWPLILRRRVN